MLPPGADNILGFISRLKDVWGFSQMSVCWFFLKKAWKPTGGRAEASKCASQDLKEKISKNYLAPIYFFKLNCSANLIKHLKTEEWFEFSVFHQ